MYTIIVISLERNAKMSSKAVSSASVAMKRRIKAILFDVDDTLYDIATGFTDNRNGTTIQDFMVAKLQFPDRETAKKVRDSYFKRFHSSMKSLVEAGKEGQYIYGDGKAVFRPEDLNDWFATKCDFSLLEKDAQLIESLTKLKLDSDKNDLKVVAFSNGPRKYVLKVLDVLGLSDVFPSECVYAIDDTLPYCKPEKEAFQKILSNISDEGDAIQFEECVMVEDSMKNVQAAKSLGMKTILITGSNIESHHDIDRPDVNDPAVDVCLSNANQIQSDVPGLWECPATFRRSA